MFSSDNRMANSSKDMTIPLMFALLLSASTLTGCLGAGEDTNIIRTEDEVIWVRVEGGTIAIIDDEAFLIFRNLSNGKSMAKYKLNDTMIESMLPQCRLDEDRREEYGEAGLSEGMCLMINGDFSMVEGLDRLYLNICKAYPAPRVRYEPLDRMVVEECEFLDHVANYSEDNGTVPLAPTSYSLESRGSSDAIFAITYPTTSGTIRLYSNNSFTNLDSGIHGLVPIDIDCNEVGTVSYDCSKWPQTQEGLQADPDIWNSFFPMVPPYPSENGTRWYVTNCHNAFQNTPGVHVVSYDTEISPSGEVIWQKTPHPQDSDGYKHGVYLTGHEGSADICENAPIFVDEQGFIESSGNPHGGWSACSDWERGWITECPRYDFETAWEYGGAGQHHLKMTWFWSRLWFYSPYSEFQNYVSGNDENHVDLRPFDYTFQEGYLEFFYSSGNGIRVESKGSDRLYNNPDDFGNNPGEFGISPLFLMLILIPAAALMFSSRFNSRIAGIGLPFIESEQQIKNIHYSNWKRSKGEVFTDVGSGILGASLAIILGSGGAVIMMMGVVLIASFYLVMATMFLTGFVLLWMGMAVGAPFFLIGLWFFG